MVGQKVGHTHMAEGVRYVDEEVVDEGNPFGGGTFSITVVGRELGKGLCGRQVQEVSGLESVDDLCCSSTLLVGSMVGCVVRVRAVPVSQERRV